VVRFFRAKYPTEYASAAFIAEVLEEIFALEDGAIQVGHTLGWVPDPIIERFANRKTWTTTSQEILNECLSAGIVDQALEMTIAQLMSNWQQIKADRKKSLIALIENHELHDRFPPHMLSLSLRDEEALRIRWDAADILFTQHRDQILGALPKNHRDQPDLLGMGGWAGAYVRRHRRRFSRANVFQMRQFYLAYRARLQTSPGLFGTVGIVQTLSGQSDVPFSLS
jgi:hypothetical protein